MTYYAKPQRLLLFTARLDGLIVGIMSLACGGLKCCNRAFVAAVRPVVLFGCCSLPRLSHAWSMPSRWFGRRHVGHQTLCIIDNNKRRDSTGCDVDCVVYGPRTVVPTWFKCFTCKSFGLPHETGGWFRTWLRRAITGIITNVKSGCLFRAWPQLAYILLTGKPHNYTA